MEIPSCLTKLCSVIFPLTNLKENLAIDNNTDEPWEYYAKWN